MTPDLAFNILAAIGAAVVVIATLFAIVLSGALLVRCKRIVFESWMLQRFKHEHIRRAVDEYRKTHPEVFAELRELQRKVDEA